METEGSSPCSQKPATGPYPKPAESSSPHRSLSPCVLTKHHAMKVYWGSGCIAPLILCPRHQMEVSGQLHAPAALPPGKKPLVPLG
jgi:hypothetical protein